MRILSGDYETIAKALTRPCTLMDITSANQYLLSTICVPDAGRSQNCYRLKYYKINHDLILLFEVRLKNNVAKQTRFHDFKALGVDLSGKCVFFEKQNKALRTIFYF